ncbi:MAG TPA: GGDEF domain-containing protein [Ideonella sp.]|uniref:GGDEF domain-containing protein n=1 Tax=Ideonella sp. TaxID=1929293 RepID=UPI002E327101|nr:GGDEF domain-containing protein [Ideonella sp.]HEX5684028.1 GGDEF domain-containing protein [Ideonella sp.]
MNTPLQSAVQASVQQKLNVVVVQSEQIHGAVAECAAELCSVNSTLDHELSIGPAQPALDDALEQSQAIEAKVQVCADGLIQVTQALKDEVEERNLLERELEAAHQEAAATRLASLHDPLTSLPNRSLFDDRLAHGLAQARRHGWTLAVMFIDLDGFKSINDSYGHAAGDQVLKTIAGRLKRMTREDDTVSRHGGDEFLYLLMELRQESDASGIAEKIIARVAEPFELEAQAVPVEVSVKCSIGISIFPRNGSTDTLLIASADRAMYQAKRAGGGYAYDLEVLQQ